MSKIIRVINLSPECLSLIVKFPDGTVLDIQRYNHGDYLIYHREDANNNLLLKSMHIKCNN